MKQTLHRGILPLILLVSAGAWPGDYVPLDREAEPLRAAFNADSDKVRVLMLVAPT